MNTGHLILIVVFSTEAAGARWTPYCAVYFLQNLHIVDGDAILTAARPAIVQKSDELIESLA